MEFAALALFWAGFCWYIAITPPERMQLTWLILIALILISPIAAWFWPSLR